MSNATPSSISGVSTGPGVILLLSLASLGAVIAPLNSTMIAVALPDIRSEFGLSHAVAGWLISGYLIAMAVTQPLGGRIGDQAGRTRVLRWGLLGCLACSIGAMAAHDFAVLVVFRIAQAIFAAVLIPTGIALLRTAAPADQLGRLNGINGAVLSCAAAAGPLLGAGALALGSWRFIFVLNVPLVLATLFLLGRLHLQDVRVASGTRIDWTGTMLFVALLCAVTFQLSTARDDGFGGAAVAGWAGAAAICALFAWRQKSTSRPAAEWHLFRARSFSGATSWILLTNLSMYTTLLMIPFFIDDVQGKSTELSGLLLGAMSILVALVSPLGGRLSDAFGRRPLMLAGAAIAFAGSIALFAALRVDTPAWLLAACLALLGLGLGLGTGPAVSAALEAASMGSAGAASGTSSMMRYTGSIIGAGLLAGVLSDSSGVAGDLTTFRVVTAVIIATAGLACVASLFAHRFAEPEIETIVEAPSEPLAVAGR